MSWRFQGVKVLIILLTAIAAYTLQPKKTVFDFMFKKLIAWKKFNIELTLFNSLKPSWMNPGALGRILVKIAHLKFEK
jgi:hypothetical protein